MRRSVVTLAVILGIFGPLSPVESAEIISFGSGLNSPLVRIGFDPQPEPPGMAAVVGGSTPSITPASPVDVFWLSVLLNGSPLEPTDLVPLTDDTGAPLFGFRATYGGATPYYLRVQFDPQPEPPGRWAIVGFDPQPEPPGKMVVAGFGWDLVGFDPQPEPPGFGFYLYGFEGDGLLPVPGQFGGIQFSLSRGNDDPLAFEPVVPEPASLILLGSGLLGLARARRRGMRS